jgi:accessory gene regulator protein AgrB
MPEMDSVQLIACSRYIWALTVRFLGSDLNYFLNIKLSFKSDHLSDIGRLKYTRIQCNLKTLTSLNLGPYIPPRKCEDNRMILNFIITKYTL